MHRDLHNVVWFSLTTSPHDPKNHAATSFANLHFPPIWFTKAGYFSCIQDLVARYLFQNEHTDLLECSFLVCSFANLQAQANRGSTFSRSLTCPGDDFGTQGTGYYCHMSILRRPGVIPTDVHNSYTRDGLMPTLELDTSARTLGPKSS